MVTALCGAILATGLPWAGVAENAQAASKREILVIVNRASGLSSMSRSELSSIFLGKRRVWANGDSIKPCDLQEPGMDEERTAMASFSQTYLGKDIASLKHYWIRMIFSGAGEPPQVFKRAEDVIRYVSGNAEAIGYVYEDQVTPDVKVAPVSD